MALATVIMLLMSNWYLVVFLAKIACTHISLQYVNSLNCMVSSGVGMIYDACYGGFDPSIVMASMGDVHSSNHGGNMFTYGSPLWVFVFMSM